MPEHLAPTPPQQQPQPHAKTLREDALRRFSRSPHPYHRLKSELPHASERLAATASSSQVSLSSAHEEYVESGFHGAYKDSTGSDSGTEADDEHFLKGLPAPRLKSHKGVRGEDGTPSSSPSPRLSPTELHEGSFRGLGTPRRQTLPKSVASEEETRKAAEKLRQKRRVEIVRRTGEATLLLAGGGIVCLDPRVRWMLWFWRKGMVIIVC